MGRPKLFVSNLSHTYWDTKSGRGLKALESVSLTVDEGEFAAVVGPSGSGKTTLLNIIAGLVKPSGGAVLLDGIPIREPADHIALVFQQPLLLPWKTLLRNVTWGLELRGAKQPDATARAKAVIRRVGLSGFEDFYPHSLSGGMQQRANLARALVLDPELLLMDEPHASLDAQTRAIMQDELVKIWEATRKTVLFVTHDISEAVYLADRIFVLTKRPGKVKDVLSVNLGRPRTPALKRSPEFLEYDRRIWDLLELSSV